MTEEQIEYLEELVYQHEMSEERVYLCFMARYGRYGYDLESLIDYLEVMVTIWWSEEGVYSPFFNTASLSDTDMYVNPE